MGENHQILRNNQNGNNINAGAVTASVFEHVRVPGVCSVPRAHPLISLWRRNRAASRLQSDGPILPVQVWGRGAEGPTALAAGPESVSASTGRTVRLPLAQNTPIRTHACPLCNYPNKCAKGK